MTVLYIYSAVRKPTGAPFLVVSDGGAPAAPPLKRTSIDRGRGGEPRYIDSAVIQRRRLQVYESTVKC